MPESFLTAYHIFTAHAQKWVLGGYVSNHRRTTVPPCVNGDVTIQWKWSNFDPLQN